MCDKAQTLNEIEDTKTTHPLPQMQENMEKMQANMTTMRGMGGPMMMEQMMQRDQMSGSMPTE